ncbi:MAG: InlB B-repeat-containing protein [Treponema sp.]|jgi:uncharacterized repeat protein (TIGR02543 family)|nr:InlB B-repeat-containing protein [Treponema sp.]
MTETGYYQYTDTAVTLETPPFQTGYVFEGWYDMADLSGEPITQIPAGSTGDKNFHAKWTAIRYTATFYADGGTPAAQTRTVNSGDSLGSENMPSIQPGLSSAKNGGGAQFAGETTITGNRTVHAQWTFIPMPDNLSLANALTWLNTNAADDGEYIITLRLVNESIAPTTLPYSEKTVKITI